jgi:hypothetical protein
MVTLYDSFFQNYKTLLRMFCFTWNICQIIFDALGIETWQHVPVIVVNKITNVLWTACICQLIFKNLNTYTTITKYKSAWKMFVCMTIIQSIKFLNKFIDTYLSTTFYIPYSPHFIFDLDYIILHWIEGIMSLLRHSILRQSLLRHLLLRQSLLRLLILRQWPIVFAGAFSNPNAVRDCPFKLKGAWFLSRSRKFFSNAALLFLKLFSAAQQNIFLQKKILFHVDLIKMLHCWHILESGGVPLYIDLIQYGDDVMIFEILLLK